MLGKLISRVVGFNRHKQRGDRAFLDSNFGRALAEYRRARSVLAATDYRAATVEALIRECSLRVGEALAPEKETEGEPPPFIPGLGDLFELAIADKSPDRLRDYQGMGEEFQAGYVSLVQGDAGEAVHHLRSAVLKNPPRFILQLELGRALSLAGQMEQARLELEKAVRLALLDQEALNLLAAVDVQLGRFDEAAYLLAPLSRKEETGPETFFLLGRSLAGLGRPDEALQNFREAVERDSSFHEAFYEGAVLLRDRGDIQSSLALLRHACSLAPDEITYNVALVKLVLEHELDEEMGLAACDRLMVTDEPNRWQYLFWISELYLRRGWRREARDPLIKALNLVPSNRRTERLAIERRLAELEGQEAPPGTEPV